MKKIVPALFFVITGIKCFAQTDAETSSILQKIYTLGEVKVIATVDKASVDAAEIQKYNAKDVSTALRTMPSLVISNKDVDLAVNIIDKVLAGVK